MAPKQLSADLNNDTVVNLLDVGYIQGTFLFQGLWTADINEDEVVNLLDVGAIRSQFLQTTGFPLAPPDPLP
jgi:hypothetical protein